MSEIMKNKGVVQGREGFVTFWILKIIDVELDDVSNYVPPTDDYRVFLWFEGNDQDLMVTGPSKSNPNPTWKEEFCVWSHELSRRYEYLNLEVIKVAKEPGTSQGYGAVARIRVPLPNYDGRRSGRFTLVSTCESSVDGKAVGFIRLGIERRNWHYD